MQINIEKRHAFMIFAGLFILAAAITIYAAVTPYANPETNVGHSASEIGPGVMTGPITINGELETTEGLRVEGDLLEIGEGTSISKEGVKYCKDTGEDCFIDQCEIVTSVASFGKNRVYSNSVDCPSEKKLVGGGCECRSGNPPYYNLLIKNIPEDEDTWECACYNNVNGPITVSAICCPA